MKCCDKSFYISNPSSVKENKGSMPILYVSEFGHLGGGEVSLSLTIKHLDQRRFSPFFICHEQGPLVQKIKNLGVPTQVILRKGMLPNLFVIMRTYLYLKKHGIGLVHVNSLDIRTGIACWCAGIPCIGHVRVIFPFSWRDRLFVRLSKKTIAVSLAVKNEFCKYAPALREKFSVIYNAVEQDSRISAFPLRQQYNLQDESRLIGAVGRIDPVKGYEYFIEAAGLVKKEMPGARFLIIGEVTSQDEEGRQYFKILKERIRESGLENDIIFTGFRQDILEVIAALDVLVVPSVEFSGPGWARTEGFGRVAIEAMAVGVPVIASRVGGLTEIIEDSQTGILVASKDSVGMKDAILRVLVDNVLKDMLVNRAKKKVADHFSVERYMLSVTSLYYEATGRQAS